MRKTIVFEAERSREWIGGLYYIKNIIFQLQKNEYISQNYKLVLVSYKKNRDVFNDLTLKKIFFPNKPKCLLRWFEKIYSKRNKVFISFPITDPDKNIQQSKKVFWIPDFQHEHLPEMFSKEELEHRTHVFKSIAALPNPLVLSSHDALNDFRLSYSKTKKNVYVMPFVSCIDSYVYSMTDKKINETLNKYDLSDKKYICCMNQFWKHKNHLTLLKAFDLFIKDNPNTATYLVLTGLLNDYRDMSYIKIVENYISKLSDHIKIVGFIPRDEQIVLMHKSDFIVQPSLFEGWGTVVEDAKVLDKTILLSDIPIHREQMNEKCRLFDPHNPGELAELIKDECHKEHHDDISLGIANMNNHALTYSKSFEQLLRDLEEK